jgi:hypothetical protein
MQGDMATRVEAGTALTTLFNVWTTTPERLPRLLEILTGVTEELICKRPGFVSANLHVRRDGERLVNYAQWESVELWQAMLADPACRARNESAFPYGTPEPHVYEVVSGDPLTIEPGGTTRIEIFETTPEEQGPLCEALEGAGAVHRSVDGVRVVNYVQCEDSDDPSLYDVVATTLRNGGG